MVVSSILWPGHSDYAYHDHGIEICEYWNHTNDDLTDILCKRKDMSK
jgi:hypothetical protein